MLILAFDTATEVATSALVADGDVLGERVSRAVTLEGVHEKILVPAMEGQQFLEGARRNARLAGHRHDRLARERSHLTAQVRRDQLPGRRDADVRKLRQIGLQRRPQQGQVFLIHANSPRPTDP